MNPFARPGPGTTRTFVAAAHERWGWFPSTPNKGVRWLDGEVRLYGVQGCTVCGIPEDSEDLVDLTHPILEHADRILHAWPDARDEAKTLLDEIRSLAPVGVDRERVSMVAGGGSCGRWRGWGSVMVRADNPIGYAEGVLHELAHLKLQALRIDPDAHDGSLFRNPVEERYGEGEGRTMPSLLHDLYSYLHVTEIEVRAHWSGYDVSKALPSRLQRLVEGCALLLSVAHWTTEGRTVRDEILDWTTDLLYRTADLYE